jgi:hypothetical protein
LKVEASGKHGRGKQTTHKAVAWSGRSGKSLESGTVSSGDDDGAVATVMTWSGGSQCLDCWRCPKEEERKKKRRREGLAGPNCWAVKKK